MRIEWKQVENKLCDPSPILFNASKNHSARAQNACIWWLAQIFGKVRASPAHNVEQQ